MSALATASPSIPKLALSMTEAGQAIGVSRTQMYKLHESGQIRTKLVGRRRVVPVAELERFIAEVG